MMGDDVSHDELECELHRAAVVAMRRRAAELRTQLRVASGLGPAAGLVGDAVSPGGGRAVCRCGPDGCADSSCPGRYDAGLCDSEGVDRLMAAGMCVARGWA